MEIGNFDSFYEQGIEFTAEQVLDLTMRTRELLPSIPLSVTVPHKLTITAQADLARKLEAAGADVIQTEGGVSATTNEDGGIQGLIEKAAPTLAAAHVISRSVKVPVMAASGITSVTAPMALSAGSAGVGVGSAVNKLNSEIGMLAAVRAISEAMFGPSTSTPKVNPAPPTGTSANVEVPAPRVLAM